MDSAARTSARPLLWILTVVSIHTLLSSSEFALAGEPGSGMARLERVQGEVCLSREGATATPRQGGVVLRRDRISTGESSRASIVFPDGSRLLLGANAEAVVEDYLPESGRQRAAIMLGIPRGPFRLILAESRQGIDKQVVVRTAGTTLQVKSSDLWVGPIDGVTGIVSMLGTVQVRNPGGSVVLDGKRQGTIVRDGAVHPEQPAVWSRHQIERALTLVAFD